MVTARHLMNEINKQLGVNTLKLGSSKDLEVTYLPTGLLPIDIVLGGGIPRGRFTQVVGPFSTLKSYIGLHAIASAQRLGETAALIDTEHAFDPEWASQIGVDLDSLIVWPNMEEATDHTGEEAIDAAEILIRNKVGILVFDSIAATLPQDEANKRMHNEKSQPARLAALMSRAMRKLNAANDKTAIVWVNQLREQVGVTFGNPEKPTGGRAPGYFSSVILEIRPAGRVTQDKKTFTGDKHATTKLMVAQTFKATVTKSKLDKPFQEVWFDFTLVKGKLDDAKFLYAQGVELGLIKQKGQSWAFEGLAVRGKEAFIRALEQGDVMEKLENAIRSKYQLPLLPGRSAAAKKSAGKSKQKSSGSAAPRRTLTRGRGR